MQRPTAGPIRRQGATAEERRRRRRRRRNEAKSSSDDDVQPDEPDQQIPAPSRAWQTRINVHQPSSSLHSAVTGEWSQQHNTVKGVAWLFVSSAPNKLYPMAVTSKPPHTTVSGGCVRGHAFGQRRYSWTNYCSLCTIARERACRALFSNSWLYPYMPLCQAALLRDTEIHGRLKVAGAGVMTSDFLHSQQPCCAFTRASLIQEDTPSLPGALSCPPRLTPVCGSC